MLVTNDSALAERANFLHDHAMRPETRYYHSEIGYNYRITNLQAALGLAQLRRAAELIARKRQIMNWYREFLGDREDLKLNPSMPWAESSFWMVCALLPSRLDPSLMMAELRASGIDSRPFFKPLHTAADAEIRFRRPLSHCRRLVAPRPQSSLRRQTQSSGRGVHLFESQKRAGQQVVARVNLIDQSSRSDENV